MSLQLDSRMQYAPYVMKTLEINTVPRIYTAYFFTKSIFYMCEDKNHNIVNNLRIDLSLSPSLRDNVL